MLEYIPVRDVMNEDFATVSSRMKVNHAASLMVEKNVPCLIVTRRDVPVGILSERRLIERSVAMNMKPSQTTVRDVMRNEFVTTSPGTDIINAVRKMLHGNSEAVVIVDKGKVVGILTKADLIRFSPTMMEVSRELAKVKGAEEYRAVDEVVTGYCEGCREFSDTLIWRNGIYLCPDCKG